MKRALLAVVMAASLLAAKDRVWKTGTVEDSVLQRETTGAAANGMWIPGGYGPGFGSGTMRETHRTWQGFVIRGEGYVFMVASPIRFHRANVTVHGPIKYAVERDGKFYLQDEDGREFKMTILQKALLAAPKAP
jgi:hypothetical protein